MIDWILSHLVQVITVVFVLISVIKGFRQSGRTGEQRPVELPGDIEEQRRVREIQDTIRRKIAERRGGTDARPQEATTPPADVPPPLHQPRPVSAPARPHPFGEPARPVLVEREPLPSRLEPPRLVPSNRAELERQERLADELRSVEETRVQLARRAAHHATEKSEAAQAHGALLTASRERLLLDLGDRHSLRRAMVLREVLGPPLALR